jgi:cob(I)alamin adenosyltransferase
VKIYTKTGDKGSTSLWGGRRVSKHDLRIEAYGTVDELNSYLGLIRDLQTSSEQDATLHQIQYQLFNIGSVLATDSGSKSPVDPPSEDSITLIEVEIDKMNQVLPPLQNFILPGGHPLISHCHIARTVCRRAERRIVALREAEEISDSIIIFLNRLSDYLFILSRYYCKSLGVEEIKWEVKK